MSETKKESYKIPIGNLRVAIFEEDGVWFAQGLEVDYFAQGENINDVQYRFYYGLKATTELHLEAHGSLGGMLKVAPQEAWDDFYGLEPTCVTYSVITFPFPYSRIEYFMRVSTTKPVQEDV